MLIPVTWNTNECLTKAYPKMFKRTIYHLAKRGKSSVPNFQQVEVRPETYVTRKGEEIYFLFVKYRSCIVIAYSFSVPQPSRAALRTVSYAKGVGYVLTSLVTVRLLKNCSMTGYTRTYTEFHFHIRTWNLP